MVGGTIYIYIYIFVPYRGGPLSGGGVGDVRLGQRIIRGLQEDTVPAFSVHATQIVQPVKGLGFRGTPHLQGGRSPIGLSRLVRMLLLRGDSAWDGKSLEAIMPIIVSFDN